MKNQKNKTTKSTIMATTKKSKVKIVTHKDNQNLQKRKIGMVIPLVLKAVLKVIAEEKGLSLSDVIVWCVKKFAKTYGIIGRNGEITAEYKNKVYTKIRDIDK